MRVLSYNALVSNTAYDAVEEMIRHLAQLQRCKAHGERERRSPVPPHATSPRRAAAPQRYSCRARHDDHQGPGKRPGRALGIGRGQCINMYGMTELSTQFYDSGNVSVPSVKSGPPFEHVQFPPRVGRVSVTLGLTRPLMVRTTAVADKLVYEDAKRLATYTGTESERANIVGPQGDL